MTQLLPIGKQNKILPSVEGIHVNKHVFLVTWDDKLMRGEAVDLHGFIYNVTKDEIKLTIDLIINNELNCDNVRWGRL
jgi:hypothetical protein